ncbi:tetraacyldisaccharide 4'-kinase [Hydrogenimonas thermophila]|uniref:tetraacyldisaccharide 4'-kinase n=1 Tax=Hydrogenimonas thermophila TaxID=223786 RepID=UPI0029373262|nr:tetraacyldisaccharide 4'-kinase [Hydrogenimonas thermophila]WOE68836.1 tetraacyldisaccharide 4'-kinase [Hydrogenimonas thermophila]WOE71344.1 tetraacyldisaccharide 4'-kinase [Hydrogenimonas thermophila]
MQKIVNFFENLFYRPRWYHWSIGILLLPFSFLLACIMWIRRRIIKPKSFDIPIISIGNLLVGGSGKTPMTIALAQKFKKPAIILRGYGRKSSGLVVVSEKGSIQTDVMVSGDEAMLIARKLTNATVIVSENRIDAIKKAKDLGAEIIFLDDGFSKVNIKKFEILLFPENIPNILPLPSGPFREFLFEKKFADLILTEGKDFKRVVKCVGCDKPMILVTAIANPRRLDPYIPKDLVKGEYILPDHSWFEKNEIEAEMKKYGVDKILTTEKDAVKFEKFGFDMAILELELEFNMFKVINFYLKNYNSGTKFA